MGEATSTLGAIHGALSESYRNWVACFVSLGVCFRFRLCNFSCGRTRDQVGGFVLLHKYFCCVGVRASVRVLWQGAGKRSRRADCALPGSIAGASDGRARCGVFGPSASSQTISGNLIGDGLDLSSYTDEREGAACFCGSDGWEDALRWGLASGSGWLFKKWMEGGLTP
jgi:hypothetical protein